MRASRLVGLLSLLQARGRMSARQLASELEASRRTIVRDIEALGSAGIPVYAVRGRLGGFELMDGFTSELLATRHRSPQRPAGVGVQRARIRVSPRGRRLAALLGRPAGIRIRRSCRPIAGREDWVEAWVRIDSPDAAVLDILALGPEAEVVDPPELRAQIADAALRIADLHGSRASPPATKSAEDHICRPGRPLPSTADLNGTTPGPEQTPRPPDDAAGGGCRTGGE